MPETTTLKNDETMNKDEVHAAAGELVHSWIQSGPDREFVSEYFAGEASAESVTQIHDEALAIARGILSTKA